MRTFFYPLFDGIGNLKDFPRTFMQLEAFVHFLQECLDVPSSVIGQPIRLADFTSVSRSIWGEDSLLTDVDSARRPPVDADFDLPGCGQNQLVQSLQYVLNGTLASRTLLGFRIIFFCMFIRLFCMFIMLQVRIEREFSGNRLNVKKKEKKSESDGINLITGVFIRKVTQLKTH